MTILGVENDGAAELDLVIPQGSTWAITITIKEGGVAKVLTGYTARMHLRQAVADAGTLLTLTTENGRLAITPALGMIGATLDAATTTAIAWLGGVYDLELIAPTGQVYRRLKGFVTVSKEVTR